MITATTTKFKKTSDPYVEVIIAGGVCEDVSRCFADDFIWEENNAIAEGKVAKKVFLLESDKGTFVARIYCMHGNNDLVDPVPFSATYELLYEVR